MSGTKRSQHSLESDLQVELPRVRRKINAPVSPPSRPTNDEESCDSTCVYDTTSDGASTNDKARTMPAASDAVPSPLSALSPAGGESDWVKEASQAGSWPEGVTCFGTVSFPSPPSALSSAECFLKLLGGSVRFFRTLARLKKQITSSKDPVALALRFRSDATTLIVPSTSEEIGTLDDKTTCQLKRLKKIVPSVKVEAYVDRAEDEAGCGKQGKKDSSVMPLQLNVYGLDQHLSKVGCFLSDAGMFLQEPVFLPSRDFPYRNPHFLSWDSISRTPQLLGSNEVSPFDFGAEIEAIINDTRTIPQLSHFQQDPRIRTELQGLDITMLIESNCLLSNWTH